MTPHCNKQIKTNKITKPIFCVCVYMKIISGGPFIDFVKIWLNELLGPLVFGVR